MFTLFTIQKWDNGRRILGGRRGKAAAALLLFAGLSWWLWGDAAPRVWEAIGGRFREAVMGWEPVEMRLDVAKREIDGARREVENYAAVTGDLDAEIAEIDQTIQQLNTIHDEDRDQYNGLQTYLSSMDATSTISVGGSTLTKADLEREADLIVDRIEARAAELKDYRARRAELDAHRRLVVSSVRNHLDRIRKVDWKIERALRTKREVVMDDSLRGFDKESGSLARAERDVAKVSRELASKKAGRALLNELEQGSDTPAARQIQAAKRPQLSTAERFKAAMNP